MIVIVPPAASRVVLDEGPSVKPVIATAVPAVGKATDSPVTDILSIYIIDEYSSEEIEVTDFVKKEMKKKLTEKDLEVPKGDDKERWLSNLYIETTTMIDEGLLSKESSNKNWEIAQKGIDFLSKYAK